MKFFSFVSNKNATLFGRCFLFGMSLRNLLYVDKHAFGEFAGEGSNLLVLEGDAALGKGKEGIVTASLHVLAGMKLGAALTDDDFARRDTLTAETLDAEALGDGIATEVGRSASFTMCHKGKYNG